MTDHADVIVLGLGGMGSSAALALGRRGLRTIGVEQFDPAHGRGSSHGDSRVIRQAYLEHPSYVPLVLSAYELWRELERDSGEHLLHETGGLMIGPEGCQTIAGSMLSARTWDLDHELLDAREIARRWPQLTPAAEDHALLEPHAGWVPPERTVAAQLRLAAARGADLRFDTRALSWREEADRVVVETSRGSITGDQLLVCAGAWAGDMLPELADRLVVERHVQVWLTSRGDTSRFADSPIWVWEDGEDRMAYGFPAMEAQSGVKAALMRNGRVIAPDELTPETDEADIQPLVDYLATRIPALGLPALRTVPCMYTNSPDHHFIVGALPGRERVTIAAGFSGHGFKFVPVIGEILADLACDGATSHDISLFDPGRVLARPL